VVISDDSELADLSASRTTVAALPLLTLRRWRTSPTTSPNDSNEGVGSTAPSLDAGDGRAWLTALLTVFDAAGSGESLSFFHLHPTAIFWGANRGEEREVPDFIGGR